MFQCSRLSYSLVLSFIKFSPSDNYVITEMILLTTDKMVEAITQQLLDIELEKLKIVDLQLKV